MRSYPRRAVRHAPRVCPAPVALCWPALETLSSPEMTIKYSAAFLLAALALASCDSGGPDRAPSFQALGSPSGARSGEGLAVSADGDVVVGAFYASKGYYGAFRWTPSDGSRDLGTFLDNGSGYSRAYDVSADGGVVVGSSLVDVTRNGQTVALERAFRWTSSGGMAPLGANPDLHNSTAKAVSADGRAVLIQARGFSAAATGLFLWTSAGGMERLCCFSTPNSNSTASDISDDGSVVVGWGSDGPFRWTRGEGMVPFGQDFPPEAPGAIVAPFAVSGDGSVVVGQAGQWLSNQRAFRWTAGGGVVWISEGPGDSARDVSADGSVVVGARFVNDSGGLEAFVWTAQRGARSVAAILAEAGVSTAGLILTQAEGVSADGRVVVGTGRNPLGYPEAWRAVLP